MKLKDVLVQHGMARSNAEADRFCKQGSVRVLRDGCEGGFPIDKERWEKVLDSRTEIRENVPVIVGSGLWRCVPRLEGAGFDQLQGVGRA